MLTFENGSGIFNDLRESSLRSVAATIVMKLSGCPSDKPGPINLPLDKPRDVWIICWDRSISQAAFG